MAKAKAKVKGKAKAKGPKKSKPKKMKPKKTSPKKSKAKKSNSVSLHHSDAVVPTTNGSAAGAASPGRRRKRAKKDPNAPKRGMSAYMFWLQENRSRLTKPGMSVIDVTKAAGAEWNKLKDRAKYERLAAQDKQRYEAEMKKYKK